MLEIPADKLEQAILIVARVKEELENSEEQYVGFQAEFEEDEGLWIHDDGESIDVEHVAILVQELLDGLEIDAPFIFNWAYTCRKPRIDEFGGGACAVRRGKDPIWCDARNKIEELLKEEAEVPESEIKRMDPQGPEYSPDVAVEDMPTDPYVVPTLDYIISIVRGEIPVPSDPARMACVATLQSVSAFVSKYPELLAQMERYLNLEFEKYLNEDN